MSYILMNDIHFCTFRGFSLSSAPGSTFVFNTHPDDEGNDANTLRPHAGYEGPPRVRTVVNCNEASIIFINDIRFLFPRGFTIFRTRFPNTHLYEVIHN